MTDSDKRTGLPGRRKTAAAVGEPFFRLWQARAALTWERLWPALWLAATIVSGFLAVALLGVFPLLPGWLHLLLLLLFAAGLGLALWRGLRRFVLPDEAMARRRLERDSGLPHRPLNTLRDQVTGSDPMAAELWRLHQERMRAAVRQLRVSLPRPNIPAHDRYAIRSLVALVLVAAVGVSWNDWGPRLGSALTPHVAGGAGTAVATLDLWVTPPEYTGLPPIFLKSGGDGPNPAAAAPDAAKPGPAATPQAIAVPKGSLVLARVTGGSGTPTLQAGDKNAGFEAVDSTTFQIQQPLESGNRIAVTQDGNTLGSWDVSVIPDQPPSVAYVTPPAQGERGVLRLDYAARDDHGLAEVTGLIRLAPPAQGTGPNAAPAVPAGDPIKLPLPLSGLRAKESRNASVHDLTAHPWAGLDVLVRVTATDGAGQTGSTEDVAMLLPERAFNHPTARAIVAERKKLTRNPANARVDVARALADISARVGEYGGDPVAFLAMRTSVARLMLDDSGAAVPEIQQLLWETALRIEDGGLSIAERNLRDAEQRLSEALEKGATDEELQRLMDELQTAMNELLDAMEQQMREALERGEQLPMVPPQMADQMVDRNDLQQMMDQMREMAETGARDAARQMLSQLQQMMENMRSGAMAQMQPQQGQNEAWDMMRQMEELARKQQDLLDQTFQQWQQQMGAEGEQPPMPMPGQNQSPRGRQQGQQQGQQQGRQQGQRGQQGSPLMQQQAEQQEALRRELGEMMRKMGDMMGDIPRPLGRAERAMRDSGQSLQQGQPWDAVPSQTQAMDELQQGMQSFAEQLMNQMMGQQPGQQGQPGQQQGQQQGQNMPGMMGQRQPGQGRNRDPLGRRPSGFGTVQGEDVKVPEQSEMQRAREILDELRRRSGEYARPRMERDYIDRLLKQF